ncbi:MAG TPA: potassium channel family protein [Pirellulaceae bacterium]|jgi:voltage-gated potassium channel|nr:potassium channel family protein [Pirellulaceae bacterium]
MRRKRATGDADPLAKGTERREQYWVLRQLEDWLETPMLVLSLLWVTLLVVELVWGIGPRLQTLVTWIWGAFVVEFIFKLIIAPNRLRFLQKNWLSVFALVLPALRVFRVARVVRVLRYGRAIRGLTLARVLTAFNRGLRSLKANLGRFGFGYVLGLTVLVTLLGAGGMYAFERQAEGGLETFGEALWFTGMLVTTSGSEYWPKTLEGRILCFLIAVYAFAIFGYVTATLATLLVGQDRSPAEDSDAQTREIAALRTELARLIDRLDRDLPARSD